MNKWKWSEQGNWMIEEGKFHNSIQFSDGVLRVNVEAVVGHIPLIVIKQVLEKEGVRFAADKQKPGEDES